MTVDRTGPDGLAVNGRRPVRRGGSGLSMTLDLRRELDSVGIARRVVDTFLQTVEMDPDRRAELLLALSEGCTNAVEHATGADGYEVHVTLDGDCCVVDIVDAGRDTVRLPIDLTMPGPTEERGRGLSIMSMSTDSLRLTPRRPHGLAVRFTKRLT